MRLWTIQEVPFWNRLKGARRIRANRRLVERGTGGFLQAMPAYEWLADRMDTMIGGRLSKTALPLWAWQQYGGAVNARPDLRSSGYLPQGTKGVRIEFEIDHGAVVLSDFELWHFVMNGHYIADNEEDCDAFDASVAKKRRYSGYWSGELSSSHQRRIKASWEKIFDFDSVRDEKWYGPSGRDKAAIQATVWSIDIGMVRRVDEFTAR